MPTFRSFLFALGLVLVACVGGPAGTPAEPADRVFFGDHILTVDPATEGARGVAIRGDTIVAVGSRRQVRRFVGEQTVVVELGERALVPGFIDAHGHLSLVMATLDLVNLSSPPVGTVENMAGLQRALEQRIDDRNIAPGEWVVGYGYDDSLLAEDRHPNREDLDRVSTEHPIALLHVSAHLATLNSAALAAVGYSAKTRDPAGGVIRRRDGSREPNGVLEETAAHVALGLALGPGSAAEFPGQVSRAIAYHTKFGVTTLQDGASSPEFVGGLRAIAAAAELPIDVAAYPIAHAMPLDAPLDALGVSPGYENGFRVAGVKFVLDGSPQGRTAWLTEPYTEGPPGRDADYRAYPIVEPVQFKRQAARLLRAGIPMLVHVNGDAAIDLLIEGVADAGVDAPGNHRTVAIHAQLTREDQLDAMQKLGIVPSFFAAHPFFWGDWHRKSFGDERAMRISPLRSARKRGMPFTIHNDAPVVPPDVMRLLEIAVTRKTRSGVVLGAEQSLTVAEALRAVTLDAAYQYFEEDRKGSLSPGKQADLVMLERDPRNVPGDSISEIAVLETVARGRTVYARETAR